MTRIDIADRFWTKVDKDGPVPVHAPELGPCWVWTAARLPNGYGSIGRNGRQWGAHRISWEMVHGELSPEIVVRHRCDNKPCVRPDHLLIGTVQDNNADRDERGLQPKGEDHGNAILTEVDVLDLRSLHAFGAKYADLGREYGLHRSTVRRAIIGQSWGHVS